MFDDPAGPIEHFSWGEFIILGKKHASSATEKFGAGKDICMQGDQVTPWKERKGHELSFNMVSGVIHENLDILVIGIGVYGAVKCKKDVIKKIKKSGVDQVFVLPTPEACKKFNELYRSGKRVALLAHGTC